MLAKPRANSYLQALDVKLKEENSTRQTAKRMESVTKQIKALIAKDVVTVGNLKTYSGVGMTQKETLEVAFLKANNVRTIGQTSLNPNQCYQWPKELNYNHFIIGVGEKGPWQFYFIFSDGSETERPGNEYTEHLIPALATVRIVRIQTT